MKYNQIPNYITALRIIGTVLLIFLKPFSLWFYILYTATGFTDVLDGFLARRLKLTSELGAKLDSIADLFFYFVIIIKILPALFEILPVWVWYLVGVAFLVRVTSYAVAAFKFHKFASLHTILNKLTGITFFPLPYFMKLQFCVHYAVVVCTVALAASLEELCIHLLKKEYPSGVKTILN